MGTFSEGAEALRDPSFPLSFPWSLTAPPTHQERRREPWGGGGRVGGMGRALVGKGLGPLGVVAEREETLPQMPLVSRQPEPRA